ncbi:MAG: PIN domain-containing protein [bacterium]
MTDIIVDSNIFINVWGEESDPRTGLALWEASSGIISAVGNGKLKGYISMINVFELVHFVRINAAATGRDPHEAMKLAVRKIEDFNFKRIFPDSLSISKALSFIIDLHLDPFDAILVSIAVNEGMNAIISRDEKLKKKASRLIPVLTPEEFLS